MTMENFLKRLSRKTDSAQETYLWCEFDLANALVRLVEAGFSDEEVDFIAGRASAWANYKHPVGHLERRRRKNEAKMVQIQEQ